MPPIKKRRVEEMESTKNTAQEQSTKTKGKTQSSEDKVYMESKVGTSDKFYELIRKEKVVTTRYGRNGTSGITSDKEFDNVDDAKKFMAKTVKEKLGKGYVEMGLPSTPSAPVVPYKAPKSIKGSKKNEVEYHGTKRDAVIYLECQEGSSDKFYEMLCDGTTVTTRYGRNGTSGTSSTKSFKTHEEAMSYMEKTKREKLGKGYEDRAEGNSKDDSNDDGDDASDKDNEEDGDEDDDDDTDDKKKKKPSSEGASDAHDSASNESYNQMRGRSYFVYMDPIEESDLSDDMIDYRLSLVELRDNNDEPCSVHRWFQCLYASDDPREYEKRSLQRDELIDNMESTYGEEDGDDDDDEGPPSMDEIDTWEKFSAWMKENLAVERAIRTPCSGLYFGQTREFDIDAAFFHTEGLANGDMNPRLSPFLKLNGDGTVQITHRICRYTQYLDDQDNLKIALALKVICQPPESP